MASHWDVLNTSVQLIRHSGQHRNAETALVTMTSLLRTILCLLVVEYFFLYSGYNLILLILALWQFLFYIFDDELFSHDNLSASVYDWHLFGVLQSAVSHYITMDATIHGTFYTLVALLLRRIARISYVVINAVPCHLCVIGYIYLLLVLPCL